MVSLAGVPVRVEGRDALWDQIESGTWEPATRALVARFASTEAKVADVGAWVGPLTLLAAALGARVEAYEPDPVARAELERNLALNPEAARRVNVHPVALAAEDGKATLSAGEFGDTGASLYRDQGSKLTVQLRDAAGEIEDGPLAGCALIKIDAEGAEHDLMPRLSPGLRRDRPVLALSVHLHQVREPLEHLPMLVRGSLFRARALPRQAALLWRLRFYRHRYLVRGAELAPLRGRTLLVALLSAANKEVIFSDRPIALP